MKKTVNANIGGYQFVVDEDAFKVLRRYLNEIDIRLEGDENREVLEDIESRIADIFNENISPRVQVVNLDLVRRSISIIGNAEEFGEPHQNAAASESGMYDEQSQSNAEASANKKLYRSRRDMVLGGVCGGLAAYFNTEAMLIRIIFVLLVFPMGMTIWVYILMWIIVPREPRKPFAIPTDNNNAYNGGR